MLHKKHRSEKITDDPGLQFDPLLKPSSSTSRNFLQLSNFALMFDRFGVSDRSASALTTAVLEDAGFITPNDHTVVIDRNKVRRQRSQERSACLSLNVRDTEELHALYFDGRKDKTLVVEHAADGVSSSRRIMITKEHITFIQEPDSIYVGPLRLNQDQRKPLKNRL